MDDGPLALGPWAALMGLGVGREVVARRSRCFAAHPVVQGTCLGQAGEVLPALADVHYRSALWTRKLRGGPRC
jgi:hypothetical protein